MKFHHVNLNESLVSTLSLAANDRKKFHNKMKNFYFLN